MSWVNSTDMYKLVYVGSIGHLTYADSQACIKSKDTYIEQWTDLLSCALTKQN